jgi:hypothetical protein
LGSVTILSGHQSNFNQISNHKKLKQTISVNGMYELAGFQSHINLELEHTKCHAFSLPSTRTFRENELSISSLTETKFTTLKISSIKLYTNSKATEDSYIRFRKLESKAAHTISKEVGDP